MSFVFDIWDFGDVNHKRKRDIPFLSCIPCSKDIITSVSEIIPLICAICVRKKDSNVIIIVLINDIISVSPQVFYLQH